MKSVLVIASVFLLQTSAFAQTESPPQVSMDPQILQLAAADLKATSGQLRFFALPNASDIEREIAKLTHSKKYFAVQSANELAMYCAPGRPAILYSADRNPGRSAPHVRRMTTSITWNLHSRNWLPATQAILLIYESVTGLKDKNR